MPDRTLVFVALLSAPLFAQACWTVVPIVPSEQVHRPSVALGDVDRDGIDDLVLGRNGVIAVRRGTRGAPDRQFEEREVPLPSRPRNMPEPVAVGPSCESAGQPRLVDVDRDGQLDLLVGADELRLHRGGAGGFAAHGRDLEVKNRGAAVLVDWDGDTAIDLMYVDDGAVMLRRRTGDEYAPPERLVDVAGGSEMVQLAAADWNGDGRVDLLISETLPQEAPADPVAATEVAAHRRAAQRVLDVVKQELGRLDATKPPIGDPAAMADRNAWREQLGRWAKGPRELLEAPRQRGTTTPGGRLRAVVRS
ncbi:MAG TPA: VCBS repeat-containing protein [Planctomycetota bacterium]|nr:VCBS repeat-containing protein [Planctomycetota bacterium]